MLLKINKYLPFLFFLICTVACDSTKEDCENSPNLTNEFTILESQDLTETEIQLSNHQEALGFIEAHGFVSNYFFNSTQQLSDSSIADLMVDIFNHPSYKDTLYQEVKKTFSDFSDLTRKFSNAFANYQYYYPDIKKPKIQYVLSGLLTDLYVSDTLVSIAADYYLGPEARFVPLGLPQYMLKRYQKEYIVPMVMLLASQKANQTDASNATLIADMVYYGKSYYLAKKLLPCTPDSLFLGYTKQEMININKNEHIIWANFLENDLLYESSHFIKNKFIGERPKTFEISDNCPGRIGVWVGWQIIQSYMENNPDVSLQELMATKDANLIFSKSKYKPKP